MCEWRAHETYPVAGLVSGGDAVDSVFSACCDGEIKEWAPDDGAFRNMTVVMVGVHVTSITTCK